MDWDTGWGNIVVWVGQNGFLYGGGMIFPLYAEIGVHIYLPYLKRIPFSDASSLPCMFSHNEHRIVDLTVFPA